MIQKRRSWRLAVTMAATTLVTALTLVVPAHPAAAATVTRIMPLGDSLTEDAVPGAYRTDLYSELAGAGYSFDFVGSQSSGPTALPDKDHEGHRGFTIGQIAAQAQTWLTTYTPGVDLLMIGTNDMLQNLDVANAPARLGSLIDTMSSATPSATILVASLPPLADAAANDRVNNFNSALPGVVSGKVAQGKNVTLVNVHDAVSTADLVDGIHLTAGGYTKVAAVWYSALRGLLPSPTAATLAASPSTVAAGAQVKATWSGVATPTAQDWIGLFSFAANDRGYKVYGYTNGAASGSLSLTVPAGTASGNYELRMYANNGFQRIATSGLLTVGSSGGGGGGTGAVTLSASPSTVSPGSPVTATWSGIPSPTAKDWIGLYPSGAPDTGYKVYAYTNGSAGGSLNLTVPAGTASGTYELRLFANNSYQRLAVSGPVTVGSSGGGGTGAVTLSASPSTVYPGSPVTATWSGIPSPTAKDWIGLYPSGAPDTGYKVYAYTNGSAGGSLNLTVPAGTASGTYELRLFANNSYQRLATSGPVTVGSSGGGGSATLTASPTDVTAGAQITATWSGIATPAPQDWIGLFAGSAPDNANIAWKYTGGAAAGSLTLTVPLGTPPGGYQLRLFANNGFIRLATSNPVFVS